MLSDLNYGKLLKYFDETFWDGKTTETNWNYYGIILDEYFANSVLSIDYLDIEDFFSENGGFDFTDTQHFYDQYFELPLKKRLLILENILTIIKYSTLNKEQSEHIIQLVTNVLKRDNVKVILRDNNLISVVSDDLLDSGSYCNIIKINDGLLRKELKPMYQNDQKLKKRLKYEFQNMTKLSECPQVLKVFNFDENTSSYHMEQAETNLFNYLEESIDLSFDKRLKIIMDILNGLSYAHKNSIIHRDLHLGNILKIGQDYVICDFGLSKDLSLSLSMKSSYTEKNNHLFVDPLANSDFRKMDHKSDIYSIGRIIDYVFTFNRPNNDHIFKNVAERCTSRDISFRYNSIDLVIDEIKNILKFESDQKNTSQGIEKILNGIYDNQSHNLILNLMKSEQLCSFIVKHKLYKFGELILNFATIYQIEIANSIQNKYVESTGYRGWSNYDIFAQISYDLCMNSEDKDLKKIVLNILTECSEVRYSAKSLLNRIEE